MMGFYLRCMMHEVNLEFQHELSEDSVLLQFTLNHENSWSFDKVASVYCPKDTYSSCPPYYLPWR